MKDGIGFISARVMHKRMGAKGNAFRYRVPYLAVPARMFGARRRIGLLSIDGFNLFSVRSRDYGHQDVEGCGWVRHILAERGVVEADGEIVLITMPRVVGLAFNPVSFWLCLDRADALRAVVAEVNNTFGERHFYVCRHADQRPIVPEDRLRAEKVFHVSPFMPVAGHYVFTFCYDLGRFGVRIDLHDRDALVLTTSVSGRVQPLSGRRLAWAFLGNPLLMLKVLGLIHWQAFKLWLKGVRAFRKPLPPHEPVSG
jgi:uncharacterized protein